MTALFSAALPGSPGMEYLGKRGIGPRTAETLRLGYVDPQGPIPEGWERFAGRIAIPYLNIDGVVVWAKFRALEDVKEKYAQQAGGRTRLYNLRALSVPSGTLALCEGEFDTISLTALGIPAVGIPGANNWKPYFHRVLQGYDRVVMFYDDDEPGRSLVQTVKQKMPDIVPLAAPGGHHDLGDAFEAGLGDSIRALVKGEPVEESDPDGEPPY